MEIITINPYDLHCDVVDAGYTEETKVVKFVFEGLEGSNNELRLTNSEMASKNEYFSIPIPTNEFEITSFFTQKVLVWVGQIVEKNEELGIIRKGNAFQFKVKPSVGGNKADVEMFPPQFQTKFDEMVELISTVQDKLESGAFDGFSPITEFKPIVNGTRFTVIDREGEKHTDILNGKEGSQGKEGKSAYQVAVENGFKGNEKEWLQSLKCGNLIVTTTANPMNPKAFICDYSSSEIRNALIEGKTVVMYFEDTVEKSGNQVYPFLKMTRDGAYFRRLQVIKETDTVRQIDIKVDYAKNVTFEESKILVGTKEELQNLDHDKLGIIRYTVATDKVAQSEATDIIANYGNYEGQYIEFLTNGDMPNKTVAYGILFTDKEGNQFLNVYNLDGTITVFNKSTYEKHNFETRSYINEMCDLDNLTIDVQGEAPFMASVNNAFNRPFKEETSAKGVVSVIAYSVDQQLQLYRDMVSNKVYYRTITGTADRHSFGMWQEEKVQNTEQRIKQLEAENEELYLCMADAIGGDKQ